MEDKNLNMEKYNFKFNDIEKLKCHAVDLKIQYTTCTFVCVSVICRLEDDNFFIL